MIQRAQVRADIDQHQIGADTLAGRQQNAPHTAQHPKGPRLAVRQLDHWPESSSAALGFEEKYSRWRVILDYL